jgi:hypothetical protein
MIGTVWAQLFYGFFSCFKEKFGQTQIERSSTKIEDFILMKKYNL